jgi:hypothetical protein
MGKSARTVCRSGQRALRTILAVGISVVMALALMVGVNNTTPTPVSADTSGPLDAGAGSDDSSIGTITWTTPENITADDTNYATATLGQDNISYYLQGTDYGFSISSDATIKGIEVEIGRYASDSDIRDYIVRLVKGGSVTGDNKAATGTTWPTDVAVATYGGAADLWGTTWTYSDINVSNFGVALSATNDDATTPNTYVDYMQITVTYTVPTPPVITEAATLYNSSENATVTQMSPQQEYAVKVAVADAGTIDHLNTVTVTIFYDSNGDDLPGTIPSAGTQVCCVLTCTVGSTPSWSQNPSSSTTWDIVEGNCTQPSLAAISGNFWFHFKPGKVATEATDWDVYVSAVDDGSDSDTWYDGSDYDMLWYGEIDVSGTAPNWGTVLPGMNFDHENAKESVTVSYISNGNYDAAVSTTNWTGSGHTATLNTAGTPGANEFSMKAWSSDNLTAADLVTTSAADCVIDSTGDLTTESGDTNSSNTLYLKIGTPFVPEVYSGTITFYIRNR